MAGRTIAEATTERETLTRDPLMWHGTIVTQDRLCSEMLATFRMSRAKSGLSTNVKGSGRRRRTEVPEARTRGPHALGYGDFGFLSIQVA